MTFSSAHFGPIVVDEESVIDFPGGLPGFEERRRFLPLQAPDQSGLVFLQSLECGELCFLALPVQTVRPDYKVILTAEDRQTLALAGAGAPVIGRDIVALAILSLTEGQEPTVNLRSPVVIHIDTRVAVQAIRPDESYACREPLTGGTGEAACS
jgi:flagellar assembly factor FliW